MRETKRSLLEFLIEAKRATASVVGYGAPGKGNTLLNYCGIRTDFLDYTVDRNPYKQGQFLPGTHIPIHAPGAHRRGAARLHPDPALEPQGRDRRPAGLRPRVGRAVRRADPRPRRWSEVLRARPRGRTDGRRSQILCLGAHSDDIEIGCGGTILRLLAEQPGRECTGSCCRRTADARAGGAGERRGVPAGRRASADVDVEQLPRELLPVSAAPSIKDYFNELRRRSRARPRASAHHRDDEHQDHRIVAELVWNTFRDH